MLFVLSTDEHITYPWVMRMVTPAENTFESLRHWIAYQDYHYGYPFYLLSALVVLPFRDVSGFLGMSQTQFHLLLLRQMINVLPITTAIILLVYLQTRFRSRARAITLFIFLACIQGVFRSNITWWHPDSLAILAVVLTFFFLDRDRLSFGHNFFLAAAACGFASGTKMLGWFFFLTIAGYITAGLISRKLEFKRAVIYATLFIAVMGATIIFSNPLLLHGETRQRYIEIQSKVSEESTHGWKDEDTYETGIASWMPYLEKWYGYPLFFVFALASLAAGCLNGAESFLNRLILGWIVPYSTYLLFFVAIKPDHYWLPVVLPLFSSILSFTYPCGALNKSLFNIAGYEIRLSHLLLVMVAGFLISQFTLYLAGDVSLYNSAMMQERLLELNIHT